MDSIKWFAAFLLLVTACGPGTIRLSDVEQAADDPAPSSSATQNDDAARADSPADSLEPVEYVEPVDDGRYDGYFNVYETDYFGALAQRQAQRAITCGRGFNDPFSRWYCGGAEPSVDGVGPLLEAIGLKDRGATPRNFAITGHSSSLVMRHTSSINPRVIYFSDLDLSIPFAEREYTAVGYVRGDFLVEVASFDVTQQKLNFFLVRAHKSCEPNCDNADRFLPEADSGWDDVSVYAAEDLQNTPLDCLTCHQPDGAGTPRMLRMQELPFPWTHWFREQSGSEGLMRQFEAAHAPNETYGAIPVNAVRESSPFDLELFVRAGGFGEQPNMFRGDEINNDDPMVDEPNEAWIELYQNALNGNAISPPYFGISPYDAAAVEEKSAAYRAVATQGAPRESLPDMADVFAGERFADLGFEAAAGLDAKGIVEHRCGFCHDGRFPGISRDNFNVADFPDRLDPSMRAKIISRLNAPKDSARRMPPMLFTDLTKDQIDELVAAVQ